MGAFPSLAQFFLTHELLSSVCLFLGVILEGEIVLIFAGVLMHMNILSVPETVVLVTVAAIVKTIFGYSLGGWIAKRWPQSPLLCYVEKKILLLLPRFRERPFWSIFISKFIYGVNHVTMIFAGYMRANFRLYIRAEILSSFVWIATFLGLGYFFSAAAFAISTDIKKVIILIAGFVLIFIIIQRFLTFLFDLVELPSNK
jgi:membrane-associated protein